MCVSKYPKHSSIIIKNDLSIFLASSSELSRERQFIGNQVRMLNDEWEPRGIRIKLNIWEDFTPEFTGERKQTEYNLQLVDKSDIVFGLFRSICGKYSQEEVLRGKTNNPVALSCYRLPSDNDTAVTTFEVESGIEMEKAHTIEDVWGGMCCIIEEYITSNNLEADGMLEVEKKKIYATLGPDLRTETDDVGNMVRGLDDLAEQELGIRCMMLPMQKEGGIEESD